ncbi:hypothetical protein B0H12DRAFT_1230477 [Mycena haematopus]|nr:hypothetical protein B0H12DRAFT_1230477 [Mycena haematopus]
MIYEAKQEQEHATYCDSKFAPRILMVNRLPRSSMRCGFREQFGETTPFDPVCSTPTSGINEIGIVIDGCHERLHLPRVTEIFVIIFTAVVLAETCPLSLEQVQAIYTLGGTEKITKGASVGLERSLSTDTTQLPEQV